MKKLYMLLFLVLATFSVQATFVPNPNLQYNIIQTNSDLTLGMIGKQPVVQATNSRTSQAFQFISVAGKTDTYLIKNEDGYYLNKKTSVSSDYWDVNYETAINGTNSEWTIVGDESSFRLMCGANSLYLASDAITNGSPLYCDKAADHANGTFKVVEAVVIREVFEIADRNLGIQVEKDVQAYPVNITCSGVTETIYAKATTGFTIDKSSFTPEEFFNNGGKYTMNVSTTAAAGTKGYVFFAIGTDDQETVFDTLWVSAVDKQTRYYIKNMVGDGLVIGNHTTENAPALTDNIAASTQKYILRPVHPSINDSLYYIIQDVSYRMIIKALSSPWDTEFGNSCNEAMWRIAPQTNGTCSITNFVTGKALGSDGITTDSRLYDDKTFTPAPTAAPYCEWKLIYTDSVSVTGVFKIAEKNQVIPVEKDFQSFPINITTLGVKETVVATATIGFTLDKNTFTTTDVTNASGKLKIRISSTAPVGTTGFVYFSRSGNDVPFDTLKLASVAVLPRYFIMNTSSNSLVIGNDSTMKVPALTENKNDISQQFIIRPVHSELNDSLYYIIQDGDYRMMAKDKANAWNTTFGLITDEAIWKMIPMPNGTIAMENYVTKKSLGADDILINSWLFDDKTFAAAPVSAPYCEWLLINTEGIAVKNTPSNPLNIIAQNGLLQIQGVQAGEQLKIYNLAGHLILENRTNSNTISLKLKSGFYLVQIGTKTMKVIL